MCIKTLYSIFDHKVGKWRSIFQNPLTDRFLRNSLCICRKDFHFTIAELLHYFVKFQYLKYAFQQRTDSSFNISFSNDKILAINLHERGGQ